MKPELRFVVHRCARLPRNLAVKCDLILALDVPDESQAMNLLDRVGGELRWVKIGLQLFTRHGPGLVERVAARGYRIFLDLKLHDIPNTVASAVESLSNLPIDLLTIHAGGGSEMCRAAEEARRKRRPGLTLLAVTVLTSLDDAGLREIGVAATSEQQVLRLARLATAAGVGGLVCSPLELPLLRRELGPTPVIVTPGVRPSGAAADEQKRVLTPREAAESGASYIVVGRPILRAADPAAATRAVRSELAAV
jgi:orotidine-5'-phosphate decarboxylase